jgi:hypothetical protein
MSGDDGVFVDEAKAVIARKAEQDRTTNAAALPRKPSKDEELDRALSVAWANFRFSQLRFDTVKRDEPFKPQSARPRPNLKAIADLWRLTLRHGRQVPQWAQLFMCDLMDAPPDSQSDWCLIAKARAPKKRALRTKATALRIIEAVESGMSLNEAYDKVLGKGRRNEGRKILKAVRLGGVKIEN